MANHRLKDGRFRFLTAPEFKDKASKTPVYCL